MWMSTYGLEQVIPNQKDKTNGQESKISTYINVWLCNQE